MRDFCFSYRADCASKRAIKIDVLKQNIISSIRHVYHSYSPFLTTLSQRSRNAHVYHAVSVRNTPFYPSHNTTKKR